MRPCLKKIIKERKGGGRGGRSRIAQKNKIMSSNSIAMLIFKTKSVIL
jgi:hypothetical protein